VRLLAIPSAVGEVFNLGSTEEVTISELARVREAAGSSSAIVQVPYDRAYTDGLEDMPRRIPDVRVSRGIDRESRSSKASPTWWRISGADSASQR
jgi:hypothetical protein